MAAAVLLRIASRGMSARASPTDAAARQGGFPKPRRPFPGAFSGGRRPGPGKE